MAHAINVSHVRTSVESNETAEATLVEMEIEGDIGPEKSSCEAGKVTIGTKPSEDFYKCPELYDPTIIPV